MKGFCCHFCRSIQWVKTIYDYPGVVFNLDLRGKGKIRIVACTLCTAQAADFIKKAFKQPSSVIGLNCPKCGACFEEGEQTNCVDGVEIEIYCPSCGFTKHVLQREAGR